MKPMPVRENSSKQLISLIAQAQKLARSIDRREVYAYLDLAKIMATPLIDLREKHKTKRKK